MLPLEPLLTALSKAPLMAVHGPWVRAVALADLAGPPPGLSGSPQPLWGGGPPIGGGRYTPRGGCDALYLASDVATALAEVQALVFLPQGVATVPSFPWALVPVDGIVSRVLDLTVPSALKAFGTNEQELTGVWQAMAAAPTQVLGQAAFDSGRISAIRYRSAKNLGGGINLVVFPTRLLSTPTDYLEVMDLRGHLTQRIGA